MSLLRGYRENGPEVNAHTERWPVDQTVGRGLDVEQHRPFDQIVGHGLDVDSTRNPSKVALRASTSSFSCLGDLPIEGSSQSVDRATRDPH